MNIKKGIIYRGLWNDTSQLISYSSTSQEIIFSLVVRQDNLKGYLFRYQQSDYGFICYDISLDLRIDDILYVSSLEQYRVMNIQKGQVRIIGELMKVETQI